METKRKINVIRPPPPAYSEALSYPAENTKTLKPEVQWQTVFGTHPLETSVNDEEPIYQTLPSETQIVFYPDHHYSNIGTGFLGNPQFIHKIKKTSSGKPLILLEVIPETLASSKEEMGVKTYAQLEVVAAGSDREGELMCGVGGISSACSDLHTNGKAVLVPINGTIAPDRLIVDALLNEHVRNESLTSEPSNGGDSSVHSDNENIESSVSDRQIDQDMETLTQALEDEEKCSISGESTPLLQNENAQLNINGETADHLNTVYNDKNKPDETHLVSAGGFAECPRLEFKEHETEHCTDHVIEQIIYSEPEYSSSDVSIKCTGGSPTKHSSDMCQKTLKRTHNGVDHTVYELSPSDSFYSSADNVQTACKGGTSSMTSSEGINRLGQSSTSLIETQTQIGRHPLNRETSVSFKKPLVVGPSEGCSNGRSSETQPNDGAVALAADSLITASTKSSESSETIPAHLILEDTRTYYSRKAADRGTLYCAGGGITVVAIIVFLLIYFS